MSEAETPNLTATLASYGIELPPDQIAQLEQYCRLLWDWNEKLNLTRPQRLHLPRIVSVGNAEPRLAGIDRAGRNRCLACIGRVALDKTAAAKTQSRVSGASSVMSSSFSGNLRIIEEVGECQLSTARLTA